MIVTLKENIIYKGKKYHKDGNFEVTEDFKKAVGPEAYEIVDEGDITEQPEVKPKKGKAKKIKDEVKEDEKPEDETTDEEKPETTEGQ